jgi:hypothetical protein
MATQAAVYRDQDMVTEAAMAAADTSASSKNREDPAGSPRIEWVPIGMAGMRSTRGGRL